MIYSKIHTHEKDRILAACDEDILGKTFRGDGVKITVSEHFYGGEVITAETFIERTKSVTIINLVGNEVIDVAIRAGIVSEKNVMVIGEVRHAQAVVL
ncbi:MAG: DUF424 family protein [Candidatus Methanoplasma sp.]|jgi:hypothetical protein|nr:DUF424 family protein [Candidatus Methanoplasma sp.]